MILFVGQAPGRNGDATSPLGPLGPSGRKLLALSGLDDQEFSARASRVNLSDRWPGKNGKGDRVPRIVKAEVLAAISEAIEVVFVGRGVADRILGASVSRSMEFCRWYADEEAWKLLAILPHPSGLNLWYNDPANARRARRFLRDALR